MPLEPLPWERKDYSFKDHRRHDALGGSGGGGGTSSSFMPRWREAYHGPRDFPRASPRRPPPGHYRQGGFYHPSYSEDSGGYGCTPSRSDRFWPEDDSFRSSSSGRYGGGRNVCSRDSRGPFRRSPFLDTGDFSRQHHEAHVTGPRSVAVPISSASQPPLKEQNDKISGGIDDGLATGHRFYHRDRSSWKPSLKWSRPCSSPSAKADRSETEDAVSEVAAPPGKGNPLPQPSEDEPPKKKPRLGWGQGLAKYEKQKVEGTSDVSESAVSGALNDTSVKVSDPSVCVSPPTPCSATRRSTLEEKPGIQSLSSDHDKCYKSNSIGGLPVDIPIKLKHLGTNPTTALTSVLTDLLQPDDFFSVDLTFTKYSSLNKVLMLKEDISKELEKTEFEIDLLDNELKALACDAGNHPGIVAKSTNSALEPCEEKCNTLNDYSNLDAPNIESITDTESMKDSHYCGDSNKDSELQNTNVAKVESQAFSSRVIQSTSLVKEISDAFFKSSDDCSICFKVDMPKDNEVQQISLTDTEGQLTAFENGKAVCSEGHDNSPSGIVDTSTNTVSDLIMLATAANTDYFVASMKTMQTGTSSDIWESVDFLSCRENALKIREKLVFHKRLVKFKEQILALKFRALHHLWKEDLRLLSLRKHRSKSNKRLELGGRSLQSGPQKQRSSINTRFVLPGNTNLRPTTEILNFATTLLSDSRSKHYRSNLKMPSLILDEERLHTRFVTHNAFIEDPLSFEKEKSMINPWSQEEKEVVMEMLVKYGKDFTKISSYLQHKTTADCIEFYYKNHKSEMFNEVKERLDLRKRQQRLPASTYLVTSGKKWNPEANATSVDLIGASSVASQNHASAKSKHKYTGKTVYGAYRDWEVSHGPYNCSDSINSIEELSHERESLGICGALSSEALSSCVTNSTDPAGKLCNMMVNPACKTEISQHFDEDDTCSDEGYMVSRSNDWSDEEKSIFIRALSTYGKDFTRISSCLKSRSREQCKVFYSKARKCLGLDLIHHEANCNVPLIDKQVRRSDTDDACGTEIESAFGSIQSCTKLDEGVPHAIINTSAGVAHEENMLQQSKADGTSKQELVQEVQLEEIEDKVDCKQVTTCHQNTSVDEQSCSQYSISSKRKANDILACNDKKDEHDATVYVDQEIKMECCIDAETIEVEHKKGSISHRKNIYPNDPVIDKNMEVDSKPLSIAGNELMKKQRSNICFTQTSGTFQGFTVEPNMNDESAVVQGNKADCCSQITFTPNYQHQPQLDLLHCLPKNTQSFSLKQENSYPPSICFGTELNVSPQSSLNFEEHMGVRSQNVVSTDTYEHYMDTTKVVNQVNGQVHVLKGSPLQMLNQDMTRETDKISKKPVLLETYSRRNGVSHSNLSFLSDMGRNNGSISRVLSSRSGRLCSSKSESSESETQLKPCVLKSSSDSEEQKSRDVKIFGTVLSQTSLQKSNSSAPECSNKHPSQVPNRSSTTSSSSGNKGLEDHPVSTYIFLDDNRIQSGFTLSPEPTVLLAKIQGTLNGVSCYPAKDAVPSSNGDLRDYKHSCIQNLASDENRVGSFSNIHKNGCEVASGFWQQGKVTNRQTDGVGGGLVGSGEVSDPVAALKMHYAAAQAKVLSSEVDSWRTDIGRR